MGNWRRDQRENFQQEWHLNAPSGIKDSVAVVPWSSRQPTVPSWEKRFCVCQIPCKKIYECKIFQSSYQKVMEWNDSAGQEALQNAKSRFRAEFNGLPCYVPLPDPDLYVDVIDRFRAEINGLPCYVPLPDPYLYVDFIDCSSSIDPKLFSALNGERRVSDHVEDDRERQIQYSALWNQPIIPTATGWGEDIYDNPVIKPCSTMGPMGPTCENYNSNVRGHRGEENKVV